MTTAICWAHTKAAEMGVINIRVLAAGALSGTEDRHPLGSPSVEPIGSGGSYRTDVERARRLEPLIARGPCREPDRGGTAVRDCQRRRIDRAGRLFDARPSRKMPRARSTRVRCRAPPSIGLQSCSAPLSGEPR